MDGRLRQIAVLRGQVTRKCGKDTILPLPKPRCNKPSFFVTQGQVGAGKAGESYAPASLEIAGIPISTLLRPHSIPILRRQLPPNILPAWAIRPESAARFPTRSQFPA